MMRPGNFRRATLRYIMKSTAFVILLLAFVGVTSASGSWGYCKKCPVGVYGPSEWGHVNKNCDGSAQSPVNIVKKVAEHDPSLRPLRVVYGDTAGLVSGTFTNNGHAPTFSIEKGSATLKFATGKPPVTSEYVLAQFHFHFGCDKSTGSEHTVDGHQYSGEMHLVFYNKKYGSLANAADKSDGLAVVGAFLRRKSDGNSQIRKLAQALRAIKKEDTHTKVDNIDLKLLVKGLSCGRLAYYTYKGSLTTPNCYQSVRWLVLKKLIAVTKYDLKQFRKLEAAHGYKHGKMCNNYRPVQPLNGRKVFYFDGDDKK